MTRHVAVVLALLSFPAAFALAAAPKVVIATPDNGEIDVDPATTEIRIEFDQPMHPRGRSIVGGGPTFPKFNGDPTWQADQKTFVIPVTLVWLCVEAALWYQRIGPWAER